MTMLSVSDAFKKFSSRLEISTSEREDASRRQKKIREQVRAELPLAEDFLAGSYRRDTKTRPLKDVDIFVVLKDSEDDYLQQPPDDILDRLLGILSEHYPGKVSKENRSVTVSFTVASGQDDEQVGSFDVVPAFAEGGAFRIPDRRQAGWITTNPKIHYKKATDANVAMDGHWKPLVKMLKKWNRHQGRPVKPSFLIEVMALRLLRPPWGGSYPREIRQFFASAALEIENEWDDPADLGPPVTARLAENPAERLAAKGALEQAEAAATEAINLDRAGRTGAALDAWQELFGPRFAKS